MRILILANYANGLYLFRRELLETFLERGMEVIISVPPDENVDKLREVHFGDKRVQIVETPLERRGSNPIKDFGLFVRYTKLISRIKPNAVLTYTIKPNLYGGLASRLCRVKYISNVTGLGTAIENGGLLSRFLIAFHRIALKKAKRVFFQNEKNREFLLAKGVAVKNGALLPGSGVNLETHPYIDYPTEKSGIRILSVIRIMKDKGIEEFLDAAKHYACLNKDAEEDQKVFFNLVGEYEEETRLKYEPILTELEEAGVLKYYGHIDNVHEVMGENHIVVHPSYHEGLSNVLLEAAACGRCVAATDINGCKETFVEGISGIGFEPKNSKALIEAIDTILSKTMEERRQMGVAGRRHVEEKFNRQIVIDAYLDELKSL